MYKILFGISALSKKEIENVEEKNVGDFWCDFELGYDTKTRSYLLSVETMLWFQEYDGAQVYIEHVYDKFTAWMERNGYSTEKELDLYDVFTCGININSNFKTVEDAYAAFKFLTRGFKGLGCFSLGNQKKEQEELKDNNKIFVLFGKNCSGRESIYKALMLTEGHWVKPIPESEQNVDLKKNSYLTVGSINSIRDMKKCYGDARIAPVFIEVDDGERLKRAIRRETEKEVPDYMELSKSFFENDTDSLSNALEENKVVRVFRNEDLDACVVEIRDYMKKMCCKGE